MSIAHALFVPKGRIGKSAFIVPAAILILIGLLSALTPAFMSAAASGSITMLVGLVSAYCWVALWIKRFHDSGKSGWWTVLLVIVWFIVSYLVGQAIIPMTGVDMSVLQGTTDFGEIMRISQEIGRETAVPSAIAGAVVSAIFAFGVNAILKSDPTENQYGPPTNGTSTGAAADTPAA